MANVDIEAGGRSPPRNKTQCQWWHCSTQENKTNIPDTLQILLDCEEKGKNLSYQDPPSIYMIPESVRKQHLDSFKPQVVSIGPLHREDGTLKEFEERKTTYLHHLLRRLDVEPRQILDTCLHKVNASLIKIRSCYDGIGMKTYTDDELAKMMVMDACFILDFIFLSEEHRPFTSRNALLTHSISRDLLLLENQIPFFVLRDIFDCTIHNIVTDGLISGVLQYLRKLNPFKEIGTGVVDTNIPHHHILGLLQKSFHPTPTPTPTPTHHINNIPSTCPSFEFPTHCAQDLDKAGVKFKPYKDNNWTLAMDFHSPRFKIFRWCWGNRTLRMPKLCIDENTELFFRNIIAYEQCTPDVPDYLTSYVCAIDMLLDTKEDLSKLVESQVLSNNLGSNKQATKMLNEISKQFVFEEFYYKEQWQKLHNYYDSFLPKNIALLKRTYFNSPWNIIALLAGIVVFALTILQTVLRIVK